MIVLLDIREDLMLQVTAMGIQLYNSFSMHSAEKHLKVLKQVKICTRKFIKQSTFKYTVLRLCRFMQARLFSLSN